MKTAEHKSSAPASGNRQAQPFFSKGGNDRFTDARAPFFSSPGPAIQTKLSVGEPDDKYEKEADEVADKVIQRLSINRNNKRDNFEPKERINSQGISRGLVPVLQSKCTACKEEELQLKPIFESNNTLDADDNQIVRKCKECETEDKQKLLSKAADGPDPLEYYGNLALGALSGPTGGQAMEEVPVQKKAQDGYPTGTASFDSSLSTEMSHGGTALSPDLQTAMEYSFGADFSHVRIHDNSPAQKLNEEVHAKAFTHQNHIFFNANQYDPASVNGKHLLAHELTHTLQQGSSKPATIQRKIGDGHDFPPSSRFSGNVILEDVFDNRKLIARGNLGNGLHVTLIQQVLVARNYLLPTFGADGRFGDETERAVKAFQQDVGLAADGRVGFRTIDFLDKRDRNQEVTPPVRPVTLNTPFNTNNAIVQPGAPPSTPLSGCIYGMTFPENVQVGIDLINNAGIWQPVLSEVIGNYSMQTRLLPGQTEVTGPGGNSTSANYCAQITELNRLGNCPGGAPAATWYMLSAVLAHERVHATRFRTALIHPSVITPLETAIEGITVPAAGLSANRFIAELFIRTNPAFAAALAAARTNWLARILILVTGDHGAGSPTSNAEHAIVDPMVRRICAHARSNGWPACPPLCT